jgi:hypothetical protein
LNLSNGFNLSIAKLLAKFNAITLLNSFRHFAIIDTPPRAHNTYTIIDLLPATDAVCKRGKNSRMRINVPSTSTVKDTSRA